MTGIYTFLIVILLVQLEQRLAILFYIREHKRLESKLVKLVPNFKAGLVLFTCLMLGGCAVEESQIDAAIMWASEQGMHEVVLALTVLMAYVLYKKKKGKQAPSEPQPVGSEAETDKIGKITNAGNVIMRIAGWVKRLRKNK